MAEIEGCGSCRFFAWYSDPAQQPVPVGECRRFPTPVRKLPGEWCGEFKLAEEKPAEPEPKTEDDEAFRARVQTAAGRETVNQKRIETATGGDLDMVGAIYGVERR